LQFIFLYLAKKYFGNVKNNLALLYGVGKNGAQFVPWDLPWQELFTPSGALGWPFSFPGSKEMWRPQIIVDSYSIRLWLWKGKMREHQAMPSPFWTISWLLTEIRVYTTWNKISQTVLTFFPNSYKENYLPHLCFLYVMHFMDIW
jgi:hypothetical protein